MSDDRGFLGKCVISFCLSFGALTLLSCSSVQDQDISVNPRLLTAKEFGPDFVVAEQPRSSESSPTATRSFTPVFVSEKCHQEKTNLEKTQTRSTLVVVHTPDRSRFYGTNLWSGVNSLDPYRTVFLGDCTETTTTMKPNDK